LAVPVVLDKETFPLANIRGDAWLVVSIVEFFISIVLSLLIVSRAGDDLALVFMVRFSPVIRPWLTIKAEEFVPRVSIVESASSILDFCPWL